MRVSKVKQILAASASSVAMKPRTKEHSAAAALKDLFSSNRAGNAQTPSPETSRGGVANCIRTGSPDSTEVDGNAISAPMLFSYTSPGLFRQKKEVRKERKAKWVIKNTQTDRFDHLVRMCARKLGTESTFEILGKLGRETGIKECNSLISLYLDEAKNSTNVDDSSIHIHKIIGLFKFINEEGLQFENKTYHSFFMYLVDMRMTPEFQLSIDLVRNGNSSSATGLDYYEMLFYLKIDDKRKIQDLCNQISVSNDMDSYGSAENYLLAFCDTDSKVEILQFLEMFGMRKLSSLEHTIRVFNSFGRLSLATFLVEFAQTLQKRAMSEEDISRIICAFVLCLPNLSVEEIFSEFNILHEKLKVTPSSCSYEKLVEYFCKAAKVNAAVVAIKEMYHFGFVPSSRTFGLVIWMIEHMGEFDLVRILYSIMQQAKLIPEEGTIKSLINILTRMDDFVGAHDLLFKDLKKMKKTLTTGMHNALVAAYFRKGDFNGALAVVKLMEDGSVERDAETFSYLIANCPCEQQIVKYHEEMKKSGIKATRQVFMALINAFANVGRFDKAKQILLDEAIPVKNLNEIKSVLISALAINGEVISALDMYNEMKQGGCIPQAKAVCTLIEYIRSEGNIDILLQLLGELNGSKYWFDACGRVVQYCVRYSILSSVVVLLKQMQEVDEVGVNTVIDQAFSQLWAKEPTNLRFGLQLLQIVKELGLHPSRATLDFLLSCCIKVRDPEMARIIWSKYRDFHLPYNILTFLRMYQVLLASGEHSEAKKILKRIQKDDPHVCLVLEACDATYGPLQVEQR